MPTSSAPASATPPLDGIRILDCSRVLAGPFATMLLADLGAEVWKIEPPGGDETRTWGPPFWGDPADRLSAYFAAVNRNKRSVVLNLRTADGRELLDRLAGSCDLLVHNYRPTVADRLGLAPVRLAGQHPRLVVVSVGGFPGASAERAAYDLLAQAVTGLMAITGEREDGPMKVGVALLDLITGLEAAVGALAALIGRDGRPGAGGGAAHVSVNLVETGVTSLVNVLGNFLASGEEPMRHGSQHPNIVPYQVFAAADGHVAVAVGNDAQFGRLLHVLGLDADADQRFATNADRLARRDELIELLAAAIRRRRRDELVAALEAADVPAGPVNTVGEAVEMLRRLEGAAWTERLGGMELAPSPIRIGGRRLPVRLPPPRLGADTDAILGAVGLSGKEVELLRRRGIVA